MMKTYYITYKIGIQVEAENEDDAYAMSDWWSDGEVIDSQIEEIGDDSVDNATNKYYIVPKNNLAIEISAAHDKCEAMEIFANSMSLDMNDYFAVVTEEEMRNK